MDIPEPTYSRAYNSQCAALHKAGLEEATKSMKSGCPGAIQSLELVQGMEVQAGVGRHYTGPIRFAEGRMLFTTPFLFHRIPLYFCVVHVCLVYYWILRNVCYYNVLYVMLRCSEHFQ